MKRWRADPTEQNFWGVVLAYAGVGFKTYSGLPFTYEVRKGRNGEYTKELWIDRREKSKSLAWSSIILALKNIKGEVVDRPKALVDDYVGDKIPLWEKIMDRQGTVCCAWEKTAFEEGLKVGIRLMMEVYGM